MFWTARHGGNWVAVRAEDIVRIQHEHETFSHALISIPRETAFPMYPLTLDPPDQAPYRRLIQPAFMLRAITGLEARAREVAVAEIEKLAPQGEWRRGALSELGRLKCSGAEGRNGPTGRTPA